MGYFLGQNCFVYNLSDELSLDDNLKVLKIYKDILADQQFCDKFNVYDIVPSYNSVAFHFEYANPFELKEAISNRIHHVDYNQMIQSQTHKIDVKYNGQDLELAAEKLGIEVAEIIKRHTQNEYHIAMLGFKPYLPYLLGLDKSLTLPRLETPRNRIAAGSIGIGGSQTTIFPEQTPSGWNIIGISDFNNFSSLKPGDKIVFKEI
ncbi:carboxyltransferase domain-containing protein [Francisella sp. 19X1-34]|uniref:5-oxoprolinase subunit B family protein n=1 Tax=Francisella sp. 19X1-34 TaxID=3087177 RepID=UPI002E37BD45|nr:carboxyltransferase domain-containing protein [Francisella sp. 19X1-34]MED7787931.1 carboxyltransferase domain-containing protein [Francisella sp. 19X1-34]